MSHIEVESWKSICDTVYETGNELPKSGIIYCCTDHIDNFVRDILEQHSQEKYIVVSAASDFSVFYAKDITLYNDRFRWIKMDPNVLEFPLRDYIMRARVNVGRFLERDKFHIRCYPWTHSSFPLIPNNFICWFLTNAFIEEPNIINIPFGIMPEVAQVVDRFKLKLDEKKNRIYCNWVDYTEERVVLRKWAKGNPLCIWEEKLPVESYLASLALETFVLCPAGNSMADSYRILEALLVGSIPIIEDTGPWTKVYDGLSVIKLKYPDIFSITKEFLVNSVWQIKERIEKCQYNYELLNFEYWKNLVLSCRNLL